MLDGLRGGKYSTKAKPLAVYEIIETMLPDATYQGENHTGSCLEVCVGL